MYGLKIGIGFVHELRSNAKVGRRIVFRYVPTYDQEGKNSGGSSRTNRSANDVLSVLSCHVETVCLLSKLNAKQHIEINLDMDELDLTDAEKKATYQEIKDYVLEHSGLKVSSLYIAQVKQKCGIIERENYNKPKSEDAKQPQCPPDKEKAIKEALTHFGMI